MLEQHLFETCDARAARYQQPEQSAEFGALFTDPTTGEMHSYASMIESASKAAAQFELNLEHHNDRAKMRALLGEKIQRDVLPICPMSFIAKMPDKLLNARKSGTFGVHMVSGKGIVLWDDKASLSRLCPDDAREEASRLQRRYVPAVEQAWKDGCHVQYAVFTMPNFAPGELAKGMKQIYDRFRGLLKKKDADGNLLFPEIEGALCVLEAPMAWDRTWNVHLNVMLVVRGFCDYAKLRRLWHWNVEFKKLPTGDVEHLRKSFRELIKYAVQATSEKSAEKVSARAGEGDRQADAAVSGRSSTEDSGGHDDRSIKATAPPMLAWTGLELAEWLCAMHGFRRTRSYGCLYGAPKPEAENLDKFVWLGHVRWRHGGYRLRVSLLDSIPEDKSGASSPLDRWQRYCRRVIPPPDDQIEGAGRADQPLEQLCN